MDECKPLPRGRRRLVPFHAVQTVEQRRAELSLSGRTPALGGQLEAPGGARRLAHGRREPTANPAQPGAGAHRARCGVAPRGKRGRKPPREETRGLREGSFLGGVHFLGGYYFFSLTKIGGATRRVQGVILFSLTILHAQSWRRMAGVVGETPPPARPAPSTMAAAAPRAAAAGEGAPLLPAGVSAGGSERFPGNGAAPDAARECATASASAAGAGSEWGRRARVAVTAALLLSLLLTIAALAAGAIPSLVAGPLSAAALGAGGGGGGGGRWGRGDNGEMRTRETNARGSRGRPRSSDGVRRAGGSGTGRPQMPGALESLNPFAGVEDRGFKLTPRRLPPLTPASRAQSQRASMTLDQNQGERQWLMNSGEAAEAGRHTTPRHPLFSSSTILYRPTAELVPETTLRRFPQMSWKGNLKMLKLSWKGTRARPCAEFATDYDDAPEDDADSGTKASRGMRRSSGKRKNAKRAEVGEDEEGEEDGDEGAGAGDYEQEVDDEEEEEVDDDEEEVEEEEEEVENSRGSSRIGGGKSARRAENAKNARSAMGAKATKGSNSAMGAKRAKGAKGAERSRGGGGGDGGGGGGGGGGAGGRRKHRGKRHTVLDEPMLGDSEPQEPVMMRATDVAQQAERSLRTSTRPTLNLLLLLLLLRASSVSMSTHPEGKSCGLVRSRPSGFVLNDPAARTREPRSNPGSKRMLRGAWAGAYTRSLLNST